jgi:hypothetical protein
MASKLVLIYQSWMPSRTAVGVECTLQVIAFSCFFMIQQFGISGNGGISWHFMAFPHASLVMPIIEPKAPSSLVHCKLSKLGNAEKTRLHWW